MLDRSPPSPGTGSDAVQRFEGQYPLNQTESGNTDETGCTALSIQLQDIRFSYPSRPEHEVLIGLTLAIGRGQTVALYVTYFV